MRPPATEGVLSPPPRPLIFQASGGPSFGHCLSKPVSFEWAVRSGPCHCGQSSAKAPGRNTPAAKRDKNRLVILVPSNRRKIEMNPANFFEKPCLHCRRGVLREIEKSLPIKWATSGYYR